MTPLAGPMTQGVSEIGLCLAPRQPLDTLRTVWHNAFQSLPEGSRVVVLHQVRELMRRQVGASFPLVQDLSLALLANFEPETVHGTSFPR